MIKGPEFPVHSRPTLTPFLQYTRTDSQIHDRRIFLCWRRPCGETEYEPGTSEQVPNGTPRRPR